MNKIAPKPTMNIAKRARESLIHKYRRRVPEQDSAALAEEEAARNEAMTPFGMKP
jgi:hypothetical protein